jgi:hypothetical protein
MYLISRCLRYPHESIEVERIFIATPWYFGSMERNGHHGPKYSFGFMGGDKVH